MKVALLENTFTTSKSKIAELKALELGGTIGWFTVVCVQSNNDEFLCSVITYDRVSDGMCVNTRLIGKSDIITKINELLCKVNNIQMKHWLDVDIINSEYSKQLWFGFESAEQIDEIFNTDIKSKILYTDDICNISYNEYDLSFNKTVH